VKKSYGLQITTRITDEEFTPDTTYLKDGHQLARDEIDDAASYFSVSEVFTTVMAADELPAYLERVSDMPAGVRCLIVNTDRNNLGGFHWVVVVWYQGPSGLDVSLLDPLGSGVCCKRIIEHLDAASIPHRRTQVLGFQTCGWRCAYYALYIVWCITQMSPGSMEEVVIKKMPPIFPQEVWTALTALRCWKRGSYPSASEELVDALMVAAVSDTKLTL
jgi:hypothetical protein